jgi:hypothetical protein
LATMMRMSPQARSEPSGSEMGQNGGAPQIRSRTVGTRMFRFPICSLRDLVSDIAETPTGRAAHDAIPLRHEGRLPRCSLMPGLAHRRRQAGLATDALRRDPRSCRRATAPELCLPIKRRLRAVQRVLRVASPGDGLSIERRSAPTISEPVTVRTRMTGILSRSRDLVDNALAANRVGPGSDADPTYLFHGPLGAEILRAN